MSSYIPDHDYCQRNIVLSDYVKTLSERDQERYAEKLKLKCPNGSIVSMIDPYLLEPPKWSEDLTLWPDINYGNIYNYLIQSPGDYTSECLKHYRSLDAYNFVLSGKVQKVLVFVHGNFRILTAEVQPSQRTGTPNHKPWVIVQSDGVIETAHCNCIAGLGETCSHVAALLFKIERAVTFGYTKRAPTDEICRWNNSFKKKVSPSKVSDLDFSKPKWNEEKKNTERKGIICEEMTVDELNHLRKIAPNAVFFTLTDNNQDTMQRESLPIPESIPELVKKMMCSTDDIEMFLCSFFSDEKCKNLEKTTRGQALNKTWIAQRCGRITSSRFGEVLKRKSFSKCFIESFLYFKNINTEATRWGTTNEKTAFQAYKLFAEQNHANFKINECGLFVKKETPYLAASPDAVVACSCCGEGLLEIKCPFKHRNVSPQDAASNDSKFCLDGNLQLKSNHNYYYQVQGQIFITQKKFCDVIVWTTKGYTISRIEAHDETKTLLLQKMKEFFFNYVLVELKNK